MGKPQEETIEKGQIMEYIEEIVEEVEAIEAESRTLDMLALTEALADIAKELGR